MPEVEKEAKQEAKEQRSEQEIIKQLEADKKKLEDKTKSLAKIIELSAKRKPVATGSPDLKNLETELKDYTEQMKKNIKNLGKKLQQPKVGSDAANQQITEILKPFEEKLSILEKLPDLESRLAKLEAPPEEEKPKKQKQESMFGGFSEEGIENEELDKRLITFQENTEKRIKDVEDILSTIRLTLNPQTLTQLQKLSDASADIINTIIPAKVREEMEKILSSFSAEFRMMIQSLRKLSDEIEKSNSEIFYSLEEVERLGNDIDRLEKRLDDIHRGMFRSARHQSI
ncbi:MAG: hypothetical protein ABIH52_03055 [Candidatus Aenigmatarchaeota archaeon]